MVGINLLIPLLGDFSFAGFSSATLKTSGHEMLPTQW